MSRGYWNVTTAISVPRRVKPEWIVNIFTISPRNMGFENHGLTVVANILSPIYVSPGV